MKKVTKIALFISFFFPSDFHPKYPQFSKNKKNQKGTFI